MSEEREDPVNKEMRLYADKAKYAKQNAPILAAIQNIQTKAGKTQNVHVVGIDVPFGDIVSLTFQALFASVFVALSVLAVPVGLFLLITQSG